MGHTLRIWKTKAKANALQILCDTSVLLALIFILFMLHLIFLIRPLIYCLCLMMNEKMKWNAKTKFEFGFRDRIDLFWLQIIQ